MEKEYITLEGIIKRSGMSQAEFARRVLKISPQNLNSYLADARKRVTGKLSLTMWDKIRQAGILWPDPTHDFAQDAATTLQGQTLEALIAKQEARIKDLEKDLKICMLEKQLLEAKNESA